LKAEKDGGQMFKIYLGSGSYDFEVFGEFTSGS